MRPYLTDEERARIEQSIRAGEARSGAEIVFAASPCSDDYARWAALPVLVATIALALALHLLWPRLGAAWLLAAQLPLAAALWWVAHLRPILRWLVPDGAEVAAVRREAQRLFTEKALFETERRAGILIYVSALERRVEILADRGLDRHVDAATWQKHVLHIVEAIRAGRTASGVCDVIAQLSERLAAALGPDPAGKNELPDLA